MNIEIRSYYDNKVILCGEYESIKDCLEKNRGATLRDANLEDANLRGAKEYVNSHDFQAEIIRRQELKTFTEKEWAIIGQVSIHRLCWDSIKKRYGEKIMTIFEKQANLGFDEWVKKYSEILKEKESQ